MRSRGEGATEVFTAESMAEKFGVVQGSYDAVPLPRLDAHTVRTNPMINSKTSNIVMYSGPLKYHTPHLPASLM